MTSKGADGKNIKVGDIAIHHIGEKDEKAVQVDYASESSVGGTLLNRRPSLWSVTDDPNQFTKVPLTFQAKQDVLSKAILSDIPTKKP
ncbi:MAG: hypothetical protein P4N59_12325 [Negativicutes bacterium]|nr:hypothetical protein [Negativicutes bacterium]